MCICNNDCSKCQIIKICPNCGADMQNITKTPSSSTTTNPNSVEAYHQSLKGGVYMRGDNNG